MQRPCHGFLLSWLLINGEPLPFSRLALFLLLLVSSKWSGENSGCRLYPLLSIYSRKAPPSMKVEKIDCEAKRQLLGQPLYGKRGGLYGSSGACQGLFLLPTNGLLAGCRTSKIRRLYSPNRAWPASRSGMTGPSRNLRASRSQTRLERRIQDPVCAEGLERSACLSQQAMCRLLPGQHGQFRTYFSSVFFKGK